MKKTYIECLRIIAIILVIYNHTRELGFTLYQYTSDACSYYLSVLMIPVCKTAVPIFLMISGATLLGKEEDYRYLFSRRIVRDVGIILFWKYTVLPLCQDGKGGAVCQGLVEQYLQQSKAGDLLVFVSVSGIFTLASFASEDSFRDEGSGLQVFIWS